MNNTANQLRDEVVFTPEVKNYTLNSINGGVEEVFDSKFSKHL